MEMCSPAHVAGRHILQYWNRRTVQFQAVEIQWRGKQDSLTHIDQVPTGQIVAEVSLALQSLSSAGYERLNFDGSFLIVSGGFIGNEEECFAAWQMLWKAMGHFLLLGVPPGQRLWASPRRR